jgi:hypothetical protein
MISDLKKPQPGDHCLICGATPAVIGIFKPDEPEAWGAPSGKTRLIRYCLCHRCNERPDKAERAEKIIRAELAGGGVNHA